MKRVILFLVFAFSVAILNAQEVDSIIDIRNSQQYKIVKIGQQWWMKENLNIGEKIDLILPSDNDTIEKNYYQNNDSLGEIYGGLYTWDEMMEYHQDGNKGLCPCGWHLPDNSEWNELISHLGGNSNASGKMKESGLEHWSSPNLNATNESGFTVLPGGWNEYPNGSYSDLGQQANFWSTTVISIGDRLASRMMLSSSDSLIHFTGVNMFYAYSVRCLYDKSSFSCLSITDNQLNDLTQIEFTPNKNVDTILISNSCAGDAINISSLQTTLSIFDLNQTSAVLNAGEDLGVIVNFNPTEKGIYSDTIIIESNDQYKPIIKIPIEGISYTEAPCGVILENTTWTKENSPYRMSCDLTVASNTTLTLESGVTVLVDSMKTLYIDGSLVGVGSKGDSILFKSYTNNPFSRIYGRNGDSISMDYFKIENAKRGFYVDGMDIDLHNGKIRNCELGIQTSGAVNILLDSVCIRDSELDGLLMEDNSVGDIRNCSFFNNSGQAAVFARGTFIIRNNVFQYNDVALNITGDSTGTVVDSNLFQYNNLGASVQSCDQFSNNIISHNQSGASLGGVVLWRNQFIENSGTGLQLGTSIALKNVK